MLISGCCEGIRYFANNFIYVQHYRLNLIKKEKKKKFRLYYSREWIVLFIAWQVELLVSQLHLVRDSDPLQVCQFHRFILMDNWLSFTNWQEELSISQSPKNGIGNFTFISCVYSWSWKLNIAERPLFKVYLRLPFTSTWAKHTEALRSC